MATEVEKVTDSFTYSDGDLVSVAGGNWAYGRSAIDVTSGKLSSSSGLTSMAYHTGGSGWTDEQFAEIQVSAAGASQEGVALRLQSSGGSEDGYWARYLHDSNVVQVFKMVDSGFTQLGTDITSITFTTGQKLKAYAQANGGNVDITVYQEGASIGVRSDTSSVITGGRPGVTVNGATCASDAFRGGILASDTEQALTGSASTAAQTTPAVSTTVAL